MTEDNICKQSHDETDKGFQVAAVRPGAVHMPASRATRKANKKCTNQPSPSMTQFRGLRRVKQKSTAATADTRRYKVGMTQLRGLKNGKPKSADKSEDRQENSQAPALDTKPKGVFRGLRRKPEEKESTPNVGAVKPASSDTRPSSPGGILGGRQLRGLGKNSLQMLARPHSAATNEEEHNVTQESSVYQGSPVVMEGDLEEAHPKNLAWYKRKPVMLVILLVIIIAIVVPIMVFLQSNSSSESDTTEQQQQQQQDIEATIEEELIPLVPNMTNATLLALEDPFSQQSQAYAWIAEDPDWDTYENWRKQQRFAMMCFYYAFYRRNDGFSGLSSRFTPTHYSHECDWLLSFDSCAGNDRGEMNSIGLLPTRGITFQGTMPPEIAFLSNLETIEFRNGIDFPNLEDMFPLDAINSLPPIKSLKFDECQLGGSIPSTLGLLTSLTSLELPGTGLGSTIPSQLGLLSDLTTLTLSSNGLTGSIPEAIGDLPSLINLDVSNNPGLEPSMPTGLCSDDRTPFESLVTDWCLSPDECCGI